MFEHTSVSDQGNQTIQNGANFASAPPLNETNHGIQLQQLEGAQTAQALQQPHSTDFSSVANTSGLSNQSEDDSSQSATLEDFLHPQNQLHGVNEDMVTQISL